MSKNMESPSPRPNTLTENQNTINDEVETNDYNNDIQSIPDSPVCEFCSTVNKLKTFPTYKDLMKHRKNVHRHKNDSTYDTSLIPGIQVQLQLDYTFMDMENSDIELWVKDLEHALNNPPDTRPESKFDLMYNQKNLRPL